MCIGYARTFVQCFGPNGLVFTEVNDPCNLAGGASPRESAQSLPAEQFDHVRLLNSARQVFQKDGSGARPRESAQSLPAEQVDHVRLLNSARQVFREDGSGAFRRVPIRMA